MDPDKMNATLNASSASEALAREEIPVIEAEERQFTESAEYHLNLTWIRTAFQHAVELLKDVALLLTLLYFLGVVALCVAILFYTFCR
jgi:hypothetical protein